MSIIQFIYTIPELQKLTDFCWPDMVIAGRDNAPNNTPWCEIRTKTETYKLTEGQYVLKTKNGYSIK